MSKIVTESEIKIDNFYLAAYLLTIGYPVVRLEDKDKKNKTKYFIFTRENSIEESINKFTLANPPVPIHNVIVSLKRLKTMLYSSYELNKKRTGDEEKSN